MASLTDTDFVWIRDWVTGQPAIKNELKAWGLSKPTWKAAIQAVETYMVDGFTIRPATSIKAAIEVVTGSTTSARAQAILKIWVGWKFQNLL